MRCKDEKKYNAIINASMAQFMKDGFANASMAKIAKIADVSPATIYIYFENKEDLIAKLYLHLRKEMSEIVLGDIQLEGCLESAYKKLWLNYYNYCLDHHEAFDYIMQFTNSPYSKNYNSDYGMCYFNKIYELFALGKDKGLLKQVSDEILFAYTFYPASQLAKRHMCCGSKLCGLGVDNACEVAWDAVSDRGKGIECKNMNDELIERIVKVFKKGEKTATHIGVEFEHFLIDKNTLRSVDYHEPGGQHDIAKSLAKNGWHVDYEEDGYILALSKNDNYISFEPGGQFEISTKPFENIEEIDREYIQVKEEVESFITNDFVLVSLGYHPKSKIDELPLLPKERYGHMYNYLHTQGNMARNMMKGTASTQVSIDFKNESDFIKKFRVANFLSPFIARIFDASPIFEGEVYNEKNLRIRIWENTDISRCKLPPGALSTHFDYKAYAKYITMMKPILMPADDKIKFTGDKTLEALSKSYFLSESELEHAITMVFPDVRLKNYIEIRMADALPYPYNLAVPALVKAVFYNETLLDYYYEISKSYTDDDFVELNTQLKSSYNFEFECKHKKISCATFVDELLQKSIEVLAVEEKKYLSDFYEWINIHESFAEYMKSIYNTDAFINFLEGDE